MEEQKASRAMLESFFQAWQLASIAPSSSTLHRCTLGFSVKLNFKSLLSYSFLSPTPTQINFPMCTIASMPRLPEHCVEYVRMLLWPKEKPFGGTWIHSMHIWLYCYLVVFYYFTFECVFLRWCCPRWRWPNAHPVGVPEISRKSSRVQHHWGDLQTHPGWVRRACQWDFFSNFVKSSHL